MWGKGGCSVAPQPPSLRTRLPVAPVAHPVSPAVPSAAAVFAMTPVMAVIIPVPAVPVLVTWPDPDRYRCSRRRLAGDSDRPDGQQCSQAACNNDLHVTNPLVPYDHLP